jgi:hypothetical protein
MEESPCLGSKRRLSEYSETATADTNQLRVVRPADALGVSMLREKLQPLRDKSTSRTATTAIGVHSLFIDSLVGCARRSSQKASRLLVDLRRCVYFRLEECRQRLSGVLGGNGVWSFSKDGVAERV